MGGDVNEICDVLGFYAAQNSSFDSDVSWQSIFKGQAFQDELVLLVPKRRYRTAIPSCVKYQTSAQLTIFFIF